MKGGGYTVSNDDIPIERKKYIVTKELKKQADDQIERYYSIKQDIQGVVKDNKLNDKQKENLVKSMQLEMKKCKTILEQLELLSIGDKDVEYKTIH